MNKDLNRRLKRLEQQTTSKGFRPLFIDILGDGMVDVYTEADGEKIALTEAQYEAFRERLARHKGNVQLDVRIGDWNEETAFVDDIRSKDN